MKKQNIKKVATMFFTIVAIVVVTVATVAAVTILVPITQAVSEGLATRIVTGLAVLSVSTMILAYHFGRGRWRKSDKFNAVLCTATNIITIILFFQLFSEIQRVLIWETDIAIVVMMSLAGAFGWAWGVNSQTSDEIAEKAQGLVPVADRTAK